MRRQAEASSTDALSLRPATLADVRALLAIEDAAFPGDRLDARGFRRAVRSPTILSLVAERDGTIVGYALVQIRRGSNKGWLTSVAVAREMAGQGFGRILVDAAEAATRDAGRTRLRLEVRADNGAALHLYERGGYKRVGTEADYYEDGMSAVKLEKDLV